MSKKSNKPYQDPELPGLRREFYASKISVSSWATKTKLSYGCLRNITRGVTRHPQHITMVRAWAALGYRYTLLKEQGRNR